MVYDVKSWWLMPYTIPVYISEVSQLNFPWVFLIIMHSNVFPKVPPRQKPAKPHPHCSDLLRFRLLKTPSNLPSLQRKRWSDATAWVYQSWFAFATLIGSDILQELAVQKRRWEEKKRKGRETGRRSWWVHKRRMGPMDGGPIWWIFFLDLLVVIFTTADPQENYGDWWAADAIAIWSLVNFTGWINTRNLLGECA